MPGRNFWFGMAAISLPILFFALLEIGLRVGEYGENLDLFIPAPKELADHEYMLINPAVGHRYFSKYAYTPRPAHEMFLKKKPVNGYRIFVLGESTTAGYPYPNNVMFSRLLGWRLQDAFPDKHIEVINTAMAAVNSHTLLDYMDEVLAQQPDLLLIYAGHNEFYGALGVASTVSVGESPWMVRGYLALMDFRTFRMIRDAVGAVRHRILGPEKLDPQRPTLMGRVVGKNEIAYQGELYLKGRRQFEMNMDAILKRARAVGVPVVVSELVSNVRDKKPFVSMPVGTSEAADAVFQEARKLEESGSFEQARAAYYRAKDLDGLRFRASEDFNTVIHEVAARYAAPVVPMRKYFEAASPHGLIGRDLMLEHLHPNADGYFLMADAFFETIKRAKLISPRWDEQRIAPLDFYRSRWAVTEFDRRLGELRIDDLTDHYPFDADDEKLVPRFRRGNKVDEVALAVRDERMQYGEGHLVLARHFHDAGRPDLAFKEYQALIGANPFDVEGYLNAAAYLLQLRQPDQALPLLHASLQLKNTMYANKWIGEILLFKGDLAKGLAFLEKALLLAPEDPQLLYNLGTGYAITGNAEKGRNMLHRLERAAPRYPGIVELKKRLA